MTGRKEITSATITLGDTSKPAYFDTALAVGASGSIIIDRRTLADESDIESGNMILIYSRFFTAAGSVLAEELIGTYYITGYDNSDRVRGVISFADFLLYTGVDFNPQLFTYPVTCEEMLEYAFAQAGMTGVQLTLPINPTFYIEPYKAEEPVAEGMFGYPYTCREMIAGIAGMELGCLYMGADNTPKIYQYGSAASGAVTADMLLELSVGAETYGIDQVREFKTYEKMAKSTGNYRKLPYAPRFEGMSEIGTGTTWHTELVVRAQALVNWDWQTATATIMGVGQIDLGDRVTFSPQTGETVNMFVTGITYTWENAHFVETLYSFAQTEEEYVMSPQSSTAGSGRATAEKRIPVIHPSASDPTLTTGNTVKVSDYWAEIDNALSANVTAFYQYQLLPVQGGDPVYGWELLFNIPSGGSSSGVGEWVNNEHTSEIFNHYDDLEVQWQTGPDTYETHTYHKNSTDMRYDHVEGFDNHITWTEPANPGTMTGIGGSHVEGCENNVDLGSTASSELCIHVGGHQNTADGGYCLVLYGHLNSAGKCVDTFIIGSQNVVYATDSMVSGQNNDVGSSNQNAVACTVGGQNNTVTGVGHNVSGNANTVYGSYCLATGNYNNVGGFSSAALGDNCVAAGAQHIAVGQGAVATDQNNAIFAVGASPTVGNVFTVSTDTNCYAKGSFINSGLDYAEFFEWADGNPDSADRMGMLVMLSGDKIVPAHGDKFLGAVSARASMVGNAYEYEWRGKWKRDVFGRLITGEDGEPVQSDDYDPGREYIPRSKRKEWSVVGMVGRIIVTDDGKCVPDGYISARRGIAVPTRKKTRARCLRRLDGNRIEILIR